MDPESEVWINGGYFIFRKEIFDYIKDGEELVLEPFNRLIEANKLVAYKHEGFWRAMDTPRDRQALEDMVELGKMPWRGSRRTTRVADERKVGSVKRGGGQFAAAGEHLSFCIGAHSDDIEIGVGATLLGMMARGVHVDVRWCVLSGVGERESEAKASAADFLSKAASAHVEIMPFRDGFFPEQGEAIKSWFEELKMRVNPDVVFTHRRDDAHQDHRQVCQLTWNTFRDHCILEYEIPEVGWRLRPAQSLCAGFRRACCSARLTC